MSYSLFGVFTSYTHFLSIINISSYWCINSSSVFLNNTLYKSYILSYYFFLSNSIREDIVCSIILSH